MKKQLTIVSLFFSFNLLERFRPGDQSFKGCFNAQEQKFEVSIYLFQ